MLNKYKSTDKQTTGKDETNCGSNLDNGEERPFKMETRKFMSHHGCFCFLGIVVILAWKKTRFKLLFHTGIYEIYKLIKYVSLYLLIVMKVSS